MRVVVISRDETDYARTVSTFVEDFRRRTGRELEVISPDGREGEGLARVYDVVEYPTILALSDGGELVKMWRGLPLPLIDEVSFYMM